MFSLAESRGVKVAIIVRTTVGSRLMIHPSVDLPPAIEWSSGNSVDEENEVDGPFSHFGRSGDFDQWDQALAALNRGRPDVPDFSVTDYLSRLRQPVRAKVQEFSYGVPGRARRPVERRAAELRIYRDIRKYARRHAQLARSSFPTGRVFVLALHFQPEATTLPMAGAYVDQLRVAGLLQAALPSGSFLAIKEHHQMFRYRTEWARARDSNFLQQLCNLKEHGAEILSPSMPSQEFVGKCEAVATCTGTIGWEALQSGRPVIAFGLPWYASAPGCHVIREDADVAQAMKEIMGIDWSGLADDVEAWRVGRLRRSSLVGPWKGDVEQDEEERRALMEGYALGMAEYFGSQPTAPT
jgi:hypothetical protein